MRKVILGMNITLDGYVAGPNGELDWAFRTMSPDLGEWVTELLLRKPSMRVPSASPTNWPSLREGHPPWERAW